MYDELIQRLREEAVYLPEKFSKNAELLDVLMKAADAIEELQTYADLYEDLTEESQRVARKVIDNYPKWIPVSERLPEEKINPNTRDFEYVLCTTIWGDVRPFKYGTPIGNKDAHFWNGAGYVDAYVTHWMPLPEPPKEE